MSFGSLKTLKLERTLGDAILSITTHVPIDADESQAFAELDASIVNSASNLIDFTPDVAIKAEVVGGYPTIGAAEPKATPEKPKKKAGRPAGSKGKPKPNAKPTPKEKPEPKTKPAPKDAPMASQDEKTELVKNFQTVFEEQIGFTSDDTYMKEFNDFLMSLISMEYEAFLEAEITTAQLNTFKDLI